MRSLFFVVALAAVGYATATPNVLRQPLAYGQDGHHDHLEWAKMPVDMELLLLGCEDQLEMLRLLLESQGWAFVYLHSGLADFVSAAEYPISKFFQNADADDITLYNIDSGFGLGYNSEDEHSTLHYTLDGNDPQRRWQMPPSIEDIIADIPTMVNETLVQVTDLLSNAIHGRSVFSMMSNNEAESPTVHSEGRQYARNGIFDVSWTRESPQVREGQAFAATKIWNFIPTRPLVLERYDPGYVSMNVLQTANGLQFLTESGYWVNAPTRILHGRPAGVLWLGAAAIKLHDKFAAAKWRVMENGLERMAINFEMATYDQLHPNLPAGAPYIHAANVLPSYGGVSIRVHNEDDITADQKLPYITDTITAALELATISGEHVTKTIFKPSDESLGLLCDDVDDDEFEEFVPYEYMIGEDYDEEALQQENKKEKNPIRLYKPQSSPSAYGRACPQIGWA